MAVEYILSSASPEVCKFIREVAVSCQDFRQSNPVDIGKKRLPLMEPVLSERCCHQATESFYEILPSRCNEQIKLCASSESLVCVKS